MARLWKNGGNGTETNGEFVPNCPIFPRLFSRFLPISHNFYTFPTMHFWQLPTIPHFATFFPPPPPFSFTSVASWLIRLRLTPMPVSPKSPHQDHWLRFSCQEWLTYPEDWGPTEWGPIPFLPSKDLLVRKMTSQWGDLESYRGLRTTAKGQPMISGVQLGNVWIGMTRIAILALPLSQLQTCRRRLNVLSWRARQPTVNRRPLTANRRRLAVQSWRLAVQRQIAIFPSNFKA